MTDGRTVEPKDEEPNTLVVRKFVIPSSFVIGASSFALRSRNESGRASGDTADDILPHDRKPARVRSASRWAGENVRSYRVPPFFSQPPPFAPVNDKRQRTDIASQHPAPAGCALSDCDYSKTHRANDRNSPARDRTRLQPPPHDRSRDCKPVRRLGFPFCRRHNRSSPKSHPLYSETFLQLPKNSPRQKSLFRYSWVHDEAEGPRSQHEPRAKG